MFTILPLACWALKDFQRHDLAETNDQNPKPRTFDLKTKQDKLEKLNDWYDLIQQSQEGYK